MSEESASPRADGRAAGGHTCTPEEEGPTPPAFALVAEVGSMGDDAGPEQLDWGSIDDEDGAFGQLSEASNIQDSDPPLSGGLLSGVRQVPAADEPIGGAGGAVAITPGASAAMHSSGELEEREMRGEPAAGCSAQQGILQGADLDFPGAPESSKRQVFIARSSIVHQAAAGLGGDKGRPQSGPLHGPAPELADSPDSAAGQSASAGADGPLPDGATPNTSVRETDRGAQSRSVEDTALNAADTAMLCGDSRGINAPADSVAEAGTRNHGRIKA